MKLNINGQGRMVDVDPDMPLLWAIRDHLRLPGTKYGCGIAQCGACTVLVNGHAVRSCSMSVADAQDSQITTIEGLGGDHPLQRAWIKRDVAQCGYCQSGQIMQAAALLAAIPKPTDSDIDVAMAGNVCRCGTYQRIKAAIKDAAGVV
ncbi:isoquinoline 1-oxidoreductase alpha subunit [Tardiphaga robiniae]|jgi:isoquinoline 1-oxidoreductase alpha subunit|uniref:(2Fe-2S)-binding protein n=1 Tax=Tardiphaga robiniae TaxID=943830 RepID=UPI00285D6304|nr:2Fe-2S iron-sulfur cluster-binding protein [Tardiphaga robiniae]MDR6659370.1 isoquinoline 1-oxidoreductase alpha subunit [Tardiphaga robiniae]